MMPRLRALLEQDNANELEDTQQREIEELHEKLTKRLELSFREWLDLKKLLIELRPGMARVPGRNSSILRGCPQKYTREDGFQQRLDEFMADTRAEEVEQWCAMPLAEANRGDSASRISFMLAWYFSDTGQVPLTRPAMVNLARVEISRARALGDTVEGLVHESNAFDALVAAGGDSELLPGLSAYKTDFSHLLDGQLGDWEKRWFAGGNYGPDASDQRLDLQSRAQLAKWNLVNTNREWRRNRWFFPDYTFEFGALPDYLVSKLLHSPELFRNVSGEEIKQLGAEAVEGKRWALIHESDADAFLKSRRVDGTLKREIIYLKP